MKPISILIAIFLFLAPCRVGAYPSLLLSTYPDAFSCRLNPFVVTEVYVIFSNWSGEARQLAFGAEVLPNSGYIAVYGGSTFNVTGDMESGFVVDLGSCFQGSATVMKFVLIPTALPTSCPAFRLTAHPSYGGIRYLDCNNVPHRAERSIGMSPEPNGDCAVTSVPYDPFPENGATDVPSSTNLEWSFDLPQCGDISGREDRIYFGTTPNPPLVEYWGGDPYPIGPLQPSTTYYWQIRTRAYGLYGESPVWSFTTTSSPVATKSSTWGSIKALYR
jgi:hypothetical protein